MLSRPMENFKAAVLKVAAERLKRALTAPEIARIEEHLSENSHILSRTPDHPPYAAMIRSALLELNEDGGSSEESISNLIVREFPDLPWAHSAYLKHHLRKLCESKEILVNSENRYVLVDEESLTPVSLKRDKPKTELRARQGRPSKKDDTEEENKAKEQMGMNGLDVVVTDTKNEVIEEHNQRMEECHGTIAGLKLLELEKEKNEAVDSGPQEHKSMRIKFRLSKNKKETETIGDECLPLAVVDEDQWVLHCGGVGCSSGTPLGFAEDAKKICGKQQKSGDRNKKSEEVSTSALILDIARPNSRPQEQVKGRGRGRPRKIISSVEREAENLQNQQLPKRRGRPRKVNLVTEGQ